MLAPDLPADAWPNRRPERRFKVALPPEMLRDAGRCKAEHPLDAVMERECDVRFGGSAAARRRYAACLCDPHPGKRQLWVNTQTQTWGCFAAGSDCGGDVFDLLARFKGLAFPQAFDLLMGVDTATVSPERARALEAERRQRAAARAAAAAAHDEAQREKAFAIWRAAEPTAGTLADAYFRHRGIDPFVSRALRFSADEAYWHEADGKPAILHRGPCLVAAIQAGDGRFLGLHRTWLDPRLETNTCPADAKGTARLVVPGPDGEIRLPAKKMRAGKQGGAIRLVDAAETATGRRGLLAGEGIETVMSVHQRLARTLSRVAWSAWAAGDLGNLSGRGLGPSTPHPEKPGRRVPPREPDPQAPGLLPPPWADLAVLLGDGDSDAHVTGARLACARTRWTGAGCPTDVVMAPPGTDFNDLVRGLAR